MFLESSDPAMSWLVHRFRTILAASQAPSDQIGPVELNRIKGFTGHLCHLVAGLLRHREECIRALACLNETNAVIQGTWVIRI